MWIGTTNLTKFVKNQNRAKEEFLLVKDLSKLKKPKINSVVWVIRGTACGRSSTEGTQPVQVKVLKERDGGISFNGLSLSTGVKSIYWYNEIFYPQNAKKRKTGKMIGAYWLVQP